VPEIEAGRTIDVAPLPSSAERGARLLPIRIPIHKGALGWRIGLLRKGDQEASAGRIAVFRICNNYEIRATIVCIKRPGSL
jgi:hypothetical protein